jgi:Rubredoxin metal binding domain
MAWERGGTEGMTIMTTTSCPACGVVVPSRIGRCPSCRAWMGRRRIAIGFAAVFLAIITAWILIQIRGRVWPAAPRLSVQITPAVSGLSADERGTDASAIVDNPNPMPVDVTIRVRGFDITDRPVIEKTIRPIRNLPAGGMRTIQAYLDATPLKSVTFEVIDVNPVDPDRP